jgi:hypothetical protein
MSTVWKTKYGTRRVRFDPPTLKEAIVAAQGLTDELQQQAEIAAALIDLPLEEVRAELLKLAPPRNSTQIVTSGGREGAVRTVIVERRASRRVAAGGDGAVRAGSARSLDQGQLAKGDHQGSGVSLGRDPQSRKPAPR